MFTDPKYKNLVKDIAGVLAEHNKAHYENLLPEAVVAQIELCAEEISEMDLGHRTAENIGKTMKSHFYEGTRQARIEPTHEMSAEFYRRVYNVISELKTSTLQSYADKSRAERVAVMRGEKSGKEGKYDQRFKGGVRAASRLQARKNNEDPKLRREEFEELDELKMPKTDAVGRIKSNKVRAAYAKGSNRAGAAASREMGAAKEKRASGDEQGAAADRRKALGNIGKAYDRSRKASY